MLEGLAYKFNDNDKDNEIQVSKFVEIRASEEGCDVNQVS